jgi:hypothetical protein
MKSENKQIKNKNSYTNRKSTVSNQKNTSLSADKIAPLSTGLKYNLHCSHKTWIKTLALRDDSANQLNRKNQLKLYAPFSSWDLKWINKRK